MATRIEQVKKLLEKLNCDNTEITITEAYSSKNDVTLYEINISRYGSLEKGSFEEALLSLNKNIVADYIQDLLREEFDNSTVGQHYYTEVLGKLRVTVSLIKGEQDIEIQEINYWNKSKRLD